MVNSRNPSKNPGSGVIKPALPTIGSSINLNQGGDYKQKLIIGDDERSTNYGVAGSLHYRGTRFKGDLYHFILYDTALENSQIENISELLGSPL